MESGHKIAFVDSAKAKHCNLFVTSRPTLASFCTSSCTKYYLLFNGIITKC